MKQLQEKDQQLKELQETNDQQLKELQERNDQQLKEKDQQLKENDQHLKELQETNDQHLKELQERKDQQLKEKEAKLLKAQHKKETQDVPNQVVDVATFYFEKEKQEAETSEKIADIDEYFGRFPVSLEHDEEFVEIEEIKQLLGNFYSPRSSKLPVYRDKAVGNCRLLLQRLCYIPEYRLEGESTLNIPVGAKHINIVSSSGSGKVNLNLFFFQFIFIHKL